MKKISNVLTLVSIRGSLVVQAADTFPPLNQKCLLQSEKFAGTQKGLLSSDIPVLTQYSKTDSRLFAFQICSTELNGKGTLTAFRLITA